MKISPEALDQGLSTNILRYHPGRSRNGLKPWCLLWSAFDRKAKSKRKFFSSQQAAEEFFIDIRKGAKHLHSGITFGDIIDDNRSVYYQELHKVPITNKEKNGQISRCKTVATFYKEKNQTFHETPLSQIHEHDMYFIKDELERRGLVKSTIKNYFNALKKLFEICHQRGFVKEQPVTPSVTKNLYETNNQHFLEGYPKEWMDKFVTDTHWDSDEHNFLVLFAAKTGLRASEMRGLHWEQVNIKKEIMIIDRTIDEKNIVSKETKGSRLRKNNGKTFKHRVVALPKDIVKALKEHRLKSTSKTFVFTKQSHNKSGNQYSINYFRKVCLRARIKKFLKHYAQEIADHPEADKIQQIEECTWHHLRHYYASCLILSEKFDGNWHFIADLMGHHNVTFTKNIYGHLINDEKHQQKIVQKINQVW